MSYSIDERFNQIDEAIEEIASGGTPDILSQYLLKSEASSTYLTQSSASSTYLTQSDAENEYLPLSAGSDNPLEGDLYLSRSGAEKAIFLCYGDTIRGAVTINGSTGDYPALFLQGRNGSTTKSQVTLNSNQGYMVLNATDIYVRPAGYNVTSPQVLFTSSNIYLDNNNGYKLAYRNSSQLGYFYFSPTGYLDIWSNNVTQIRTGTGHESDDTVRFIFGTTGVLTAPGMYTTTRSGSALVIDSNGAIGRTSSLRKYKKDITPITNEDAIKGYELNPITYTSALEYDLQNTQYGLIAEEVEEVLPNLCTYDTDGNIDGVAYDRVCTILLKQNQLLNERVKELENKLENLEKSL